MKTTKVVIIGAGSVAFGPSAIGDIYLSKDLWGSTLALVDLNEEALERAGKLCEKLNEHTGAGFKIETHTGRRDALPGAEFIINCTVIERNKYWKQDFTIPKKWGIRHTLGENGGPGGLFFTLRTIPMVMDIAHDIEELCPDAYFLNFSNPESRIILALGRYTRLRAIGLCHGIFMARGDISHILGRDEEEIDLFGAGLNHFQWMLGMHEAGTGKDLYPEFREAEKNFDPGFEPLCRTMYRAFGYYPSCSDDHMGEYVAYGYEGGEDGYDFDDDESWRVELKEKIEGAIAGTTPAMEFLEASGERVAQTISGILHNKHIEIEAGVIYNQGAISNLPADAAVEVPIVLDGDGIHPVSIGDLPDALARILNIQVMVQQMSVDAAVHGSKEMALQALLMDPVVNSTKAAKGLLDELWEINKQFIRPCI